MAFKIAIDAGHYLKTAGKRVHKKLDANETREWVLNDRVARYFAEAAARYENVELLRVDDPTGAKDVSLAKRCKAANSWGADVYASFHHDAGINLGTGGGMTVYSYKEGTKGAEYRDEIYKACIAAGGLRGNRYDPTLAKGFYVLRNTNMPAVLMEYGFMDSRTDVPVILTAAYAKLVGYATMEGIAEAAGLRLKAQPEQKPQENKQPAAAKKTVSEIAREVIDGKWYTGAARKSALTKAGYDYAEVQKLVNDMLAGKTTAGKTVDELAREVIAGKWSTGATRKKKLAAAGYDYAAVQKRVNEMLKG
jgi:N-acetylmuramoyl-L-alanine amidase